MLDQLCEQLVASGVPLFRVAVFVRTLHPNLMGRRFLWLAGSGTKVSEGSFAMMQDEDFRASPVAYVYATGAGVRRRLADADCPLDFPILHDLRGEGVTDYLVSPLIFTTGAVHIASWTTRQKGGFDDDHIAGIDAVVAPLARIAEIMGLRRTARTLLDTYVGSHAGERILAGRIRRGDTEVIHAAIWLSDMRGFTTLSDRLAPQALIDLLNRFFDAQVPAIARHGGEVLKFMGDGLLAIFPVTGDDRAGACAEALAAACEARDAIASLGGDAAIADVDLVRFGLALHIGEVTYGNIGGEGRLDFTCIGPAVNLAARLEKIAGELGRSIVASRAFAEHCPGAVTPLGRFPVRGLTDAQELFAVADEAAS